MAQSLICQRFTCIACKREWRRPPVRGTVPKFCPECRARASATCSRFGVCAWCDHEAFIRKDAKCCSRQCAANLKATPSCLVHWRCCLVCMAWFARPPQPYETCSVACATAAVEVMRPPPPEPYVRECTRCGVEFTTRQSVARVCSKRCQKKDARLRRKVRECATYGEWRWSDFMRIAAKFGYCCAYCGVKPDRLDPDHVIPLAKHGPNTTTNLLPACADCNCDKRDLNLDEWAVDRERRGLPPVRTNWSPEDSRYWHLTHLRSLAAA